jgi:hypothetical protein
MVVAAIIKNLFDARENGRICLTLTRGYAIIFYALTLSQAFLLFLSSAIWPGPTFTRGKP